VDDVLDACQKAGLTCIEWGSDVHVPAGHAQIADEAATLDLDYIVEIRGAQAERCRLHLEIKE
jgi:hypothetical protein